MHDNYDHALLWASAHGHFSVAAGADVHARNDKALRWASQNGHLPVVERLQAAGVDVHFWNDEAFRRDDDDHVIMVVFVVLFSAYSSRPFIRLLN